MARVMTFERDSAADGSSRDERPTCRIGACDPAEQVVIIAEIGNCHEGDPALAERLVHLAADAGADAVKFQTITPHQLVSTNDAARLERLRSFALAPDVYRHLASVATERGLAFLSTPFDLEAVAFLDPLVPAFKIASGDNDFLPLLRAVAARRKPILLSTGLADAAHLDRVRATLDAAWGRAEPRPALALLHCVVSYPTPDDDANLAAISALARWADVVGYSDHTLGIDAAPAAVALGARIIEKHFTIDHAYSDFRDHALAAEPDEFAAMVHAIRRVERMLGSGTIGLQTSEAASAVAVRRSIAADRDLPPGHCIELKDLRWIRPGNGVPCGAEDQIVGRILGRAVREGEPLQLDWLNT